MFWYQTAGRKETWIFQGVVEVAQVSIKESGVSGVGRDKFILRVSDFLWASMFSFLKIGWHVASQFSVYQELPGG